MKPATQSSSQNAIAAKWNEMDFSNVMLVST
jgi:hypothetical protein